MFGFDSGSCRMWKIDKIVVNARNSFPADGTQNFTAAPHPPRRNPFVPLGARSAVLETPNSPGN